MAFVTDRKRAVGLGSAKEGTRHYWSMQVSSWALLILCPLFVLTFGSALGGTYEEVTATFARPFPALIAALTIWVGFMHFKGGAQVLIEDYTHGATRVALIIGNIFLSYAAAATGVFAIARMAF